MSISLSDDLPISIFGRQILSTNFKMLDDKTIVSFLETIVPSYFMVYEILSFIDVDIADTYHQLHILNYKMPNEHRHPIATDVVNTIRESIYCAETDYKIECSMAELQQITHLRKILPLFNRKIESLSSNAKGITSQFRYFMMHVYLKGFRVEPFHTYQLISRKNQHKMLYISSKTFILAYCMEGYKYEFEPTRKYPPTSFPIKTPEYVPYFRFIGEYVSPSHKMCREYLRENGL